MLDERAQGGMLRVEPFGPEVIRVLVVDDHDFVRSQLVALLNVCDDITVVGECSAGEEVTETAARVCPDVVLMDVHMGRMSGLAATRDLMAERSTVHVLVLTASSSEAVQRDASAAGAKGFLIKGRDPDEVITAVRTVATGGTYWPLRAVPSPPGSGGNLQRNRSGRRASAGRG